MKSFRGEARQGKMMSSGGKLTALSYHPTKRVNKSEELTYLHTSRLWLSEASLLIKSLHLAAALGVSKFIKPLTTMPWIQSHFAALLKSDLDAQQTHLCDPQTLTKYFRKGWELFTRMSCSCSTSRLPWNTGTALTTSGRRYKTFFS